MGRLLVSISLRGVPDPFTPQTGVIAEGSPLYRVYGNAPGRTAADFNPGIGERTRFAFFGDPLVPVLYAAASEEAAVCETILHDMPPEGGLVPYAKYGNRLMGLISPTRDLKVAALHGTGLRQVKASADDISNSPASTYDQTVKWAEAAHAAGFDGLAYMSRQCNDTLAYVFFGDRCGDAFTQDNSSSRVFATGPDQAWLIDMCVPLHIDVLPAS